MSQLAKLQAKRTELLTEIKKISSEAATSANGSFTEPQREKVQQLRSEFNSVEGDIALVVEFEKENSAPPPASAQGDPLHVRAGGAAPEREKDKEDPYVTQAPKPFNLLGDQLRAVYLASQRRASEQDMNRLQEISDYHKRAALGSSEAIDSDAGYLIQPQFIANLMTRGYSASNLAQYCTKIPMASNRIMIPGQVDDNMTDGNRWGGVRAYWVNEAGSAPPTKPKFRMLDISLEKLMAMCYATDEELEDAPALGGIISTAFENEFGYTMDQAIMFGDGLGKPKGFCNSSAKVRQDKESGQTAKILLKNIVKMRSRLIPTSRANAKWFMNLDLEPELILMAFDPTATNPTPVWLPANNAVGQPYDRLFNIPVVPTLQSKALGTEGDIVLGDLSQYLICEKGGLRADISMHVAFDTAQQCFRFQYRVNGRSAWDKPVTPENSTNTLSPFVTLQSR